MKSMSAAIVKQIGGKIEYTERPHNDYIDEFYLGSYRAIAEAYRELAEKLELGKYNVHGRYPSTWSFHIMVVSGRRRRTLNEAAEQQENGDGLVDLKLHGLRVDVASYDRLLDKR
jgi:hypothetical protein